jgi:hypothetical protein
MINEVVVLFRVKHLKEKRGRIAPKILTNPVNLIEHKAGIGDSDPFDLTDDPAGHGSNIGSPVAADFSLIQQTGHGNPDKLPTQRA